MKKKSNQMKTLYLSIIVILIISIFGFGMAYADKDKVFFMKANSTAKFYTQFYFSEYNNEVWNIWSKAYPYPEINGGGDPTGSITVVVEPDSFTANKSKFNVTYTITAKNNINGTFEIYSGFCGQFFPLVIGLNESEVDPKIFKNFYSGAYSCPAYSSNPPIVNIVGYSGLIPKTNPWNYTAPKISQQLPTTPEGCSLKIASEMTSSESSLNRSKAVSLVQNSDKFRSMSDGFITAYPVMYEGWSLNSTSCSATLSHVNIAIQLSNSSGHVKTVIATLDPTLTKILDIGEHADVKYGVSPSTITVPEFPFATVVLALSIVSTIFLYQFKSKIKI